MLVVMASMHLVADIMHHKVDMKSPNTVSRLEIVDEVFNFPFRSCRMGLRSFISWLRNVTYNKLELYKAII
jgi:hypothetical protein